VILGCIADDFTGASDIASFFAKGGMRTRLYNGVPQKACDADFDAAVIALKPAPRKPLLQWKKV
jgi:uncharacterized protein YgbK (DUF1537 family)